MAEAGQLGEPALIWFHADWCQVCQTIRPNVAQMERDWDGKVRLVRLNVDRPAVRDAARRYRVRGTPTFVFISQSGKVIDNMAGWPGRARVEQTLNSLLAMN
ncbi:MAG: thioredoxin family protein [Anaerolineae bacterium]